MAPGEWGLDHLPPHSRGSFNLTVSMGSSIRLSMAPSPLCSKNSCPPPPPLLLGISLHSSRLSFLQGKARLQPLSSGPSICCSQWPRLWERLSSFLVLPSLTASLLGLDSGANPRARVQEEVVKHLTSEKRHGCLSHCFPLSLCFSLPHTLLGTLCPLKRVIFCPLVLD